MTTFICERCSNKFNNHKVLLEHQLDCKPKIKYNSKKKKPIVPFAQKDFYFMYISNSYN